MTPRMNRSRLQRSHARRPALHARMAGQSFVEYIVVLMFAVVILVTGENPPIQMLAAAIHEYYTDYTYAISISSMPNCFAGFDSSVVSVEVNACFDPDNMKWPVDITFN